MYIESDINKIYMYIKIICLTNSIVGCIFATVNNRIKKIIMYPKELMSGIYWGFFGGKYHSHEKFIQAVTEYNRELGGRKWNPEEHILASMHVTIQYSYWDYDVEDEIEDFFDLVADNGAGFSAGELLFKVHNQVVDKLESESHHLFEGFLLGKREYYKTLYKPFYFINQGKL